MNTAKPARARLPKRTKWLIWLGTAVLLYTITGFFIVPAIIKAQMLKRLPDLTHRQVSIERVKVNPYVLSLTIDKLALKETNGDVFSSFGELYVNFQLSSIFKRCFVFAEVSLTDPFAQVIYNKDGTFNFANLLTNSAPVPAPSTPQKPAELPPVLVYNLIVSNGAVAFTDLTRKHPFNIRYQPINVHLTDFTTLRDKRSPYEIAAAGDSGETFGWSGRIMVNPLQSSGTFRLGGLKLNKFMPYSQDYALFDIVDGQVDAGADYRYDSTGGALDLEVSNASATVSRLQLKTPDTGETVLNIPTVALSGVSASLPRHSAEVGLIKSSGGSILVRQEKDGKINLLANLVLPAPAPAAARANAAAAAGPPWTAKIDEISFDNYSIKAEDKVPAKAAEFDIDQLGFDLKNVSNLSNAPVNVALGLRLQQTGTIGVNGSVTIMPLSADVAVGVTNLDLRVAQPYVDQQVKMSIARGALNVTGHAGFSPDKPGGPLLAFAGDVSIRKFDVTDEVNFDDMAGWDSFDITGIDVSLLPNKFHIDKMKVSRPSTTVIMLPDHRLNVMTILPEKKGGPPQTNAAPVPLPEITLGELAFDNASFHFADRSVEPNCTFDVQESSGGVKNISSVITTPAELDVKGKIDQFSTYSVAGKIDPIPDKLFLDCAFSLTNTGLTAFSPYTEKYAGRPLEKGKLSLALRYKIDHQALDAQNDIFVDQLTLGAKNGSTNATKLPVKLAVALLKDRNGRIKLDPHVTGTIGDPKFHLWPIIWGVVENLIFKAATSPFSLLGSMFGGGPELAYVDFDPGLSAVPATQTNKLATLTKALYNRPELTMEINGSVDPAKDRPIMVQAKFDRQLKALYLKELADAGKPAVAIDQVTLSTNDYDRLVAEAYTNAFGPYHPPDTNQTTNVTAAAAPAPVPKPATATPPQIPPSFAHGGASMVHFSTVTESNALPAPAVSPAATTNAVAATAPGAFTPGASDLEVMRAQLMGKIEITSDDLKQLMQDRAKEVEAYLLKSGQVTAERLFLTAPRPMSANSQGQDRVNLTLD